MSSEQEYLQIDELDLMELYEKFVTLLEEYRADGYNLPSLKIFNKDYDFKEFVSGNGKEIPEYISLTADKILNLVENGIYFNVHIETIYTKDYNFTRKKAGTTILYASLQYNRGSLSVNNEEIFKEEHTRKRLLKRILRVLLKPDNPYQEAIDEDK
ncbi:hypothetical protein HN827_05335 [archaeon]|jgi:hypothetical protein|nr:hypothetical protein [archaeon]MBT7392227.1 hypothetical protein [archaeon]